ncbi:MAG: hypothetical protein MI864_04675 [Pseudomonadales bacterium]|nr:hypothetical protein [Pseudomonadales bacterium]
MKRQQSVFIAGLLSCFISGVAAIESTVPRPSLSSSSTHVLYIHSPDFPPYQTTEPAPRGLMSRFGITVATLLGGEVSLFYRSTETSVLAPEKASEADGACYLTGYFQPDPSFPLQSVDLHISSAVLVTRKDERTIKHYSGLTNKVIGALEKTPQNPILQDFAHSGLVELPVFSSTQGMITALRDGTLDGFRLDQFRITPMMHNEFSIQPITLNHYHFQCALKSSEANQKQLRRLNKAFQVLQRSGKLERTLDDYRTEFYRANPQR